MHASFRTLVYSLSSCLLLITLSACSKCGSKTVDKAQYISTLDEQCKGIISKGEAIGKEFAMKELGKKTELNKAAAEADFAARLIERGMDLDDEEMAIVKKVAAPAEDATTLEQIWSRKAELNKAVRTMIATQKKLVAALSKLSEEELGKSANQMTEEERAKPEVKEFDEAVKAAAASQKDALEKGQALSDLAVKYGFKICFQPQAQTPSK